MERYEGPTIELDSELRWGPCRNCTYFSPELIGGFCNGPELALGYLVRDNSTCEQWFPVLTSVPPDSAMPRR